MSLRCNTCRSEIPPGNASCPRCGAPVTGGPPARAIERLEDVAPGAILADRYEMIRELGAGGMGVVWLAHDRVRDEPVALKLLPRAVAHDPVAMVGIRREANLSLKLTHPNILRLLNLELAPFPFLLMEYVEGRSLQNVLAEKMEMAEDGVGRLTPHEIVTWLPGLADGLDHAHKLGVVHRDIKPANIMLVGELDAPIVKLTDFGIAAQLRDTATHLTQQGMAGTPVYMAPEQLKRKKIDKRVDVYSLGVTIYQLLSGTLPFLSEYQIHNEAPPEIEGQTQLMYEVLCKALAREPNDRYQSAGELAADFALVVEHGDKPLPDGGHVAAPPPSQHQSPPAYAPPNPVSAPGQPVYAPPNPVSAPGQPVYAPPQAAYAAQAAVAQAPLGSRAAAAVADPHPTPDASPAAVPTHPGESRAIAQAGLAAMAGESAVARRLRLAKGGGAPVEPPPWTQVSAAAPVPPALAEPAYAPPVPPPVEPAHQAPAPGAPPPAHEPPVQAAPVYQPPAPPPPPPPPVQAQKKAKPVIPPGFTPAGTNAKGREQYRCEKDGALMVLVPAGSFQMGSAEFAEDEKPPHLVTTKAFLIDVTPVTNSMFGNFVTQAAYQTEAERDGKGWAFDGKRFTVAVKGADWKHPSGPDDSIAGKDNAPVVQVSWLDAEAYAKWAGKTLPTEAIWERAARGGGTGAFPFGDGGPEGRANFNNPTSRGPAKVGSYPANGYGLLDMAGNVWEWCSDWYSATYYKEAPAVDPAGPANGGSKVVRGGNWHGSSQQLRCGYRHRCDPVQRNSGTGFRCVVILESVEEA